MAGGVFGRATRLGTVAMQLRKIKLLCNASRGGRCARASGKCLQAGGGSPVAQDFSGHDQEGWNEEALRLRLFNRTKFGSKLFCSQCCWAGSLRQHYRDGCGLAGFSRCGSEGYRYFEFEGHCGRDHDKRQRKLYRDALNSGLVQHPD